MFLAAVNKLIKEMIPNVRVSNDARELILNCCTGILAPSWIAILGFLVSQDLTVVTCKGIFTCVDKANQYSAILEP